MLFIQWEEDTELFVFEFALLALRGDRDQGHPTAVLGKGWGKGQTAQRGKRVGLAFGNMALVGPRLSHAQCPVTHSHGGPPACYMGASPVCGEAEMLSSVDGGQLLRAVTIGTQMPQGPLRLPSIFLHSYQEKGKEANIQGRGALCICITSPTSQNIPTYRYF